MKDDTYINKYFPDYPEHKVPDRPYFYAVINTICDDYITKIVKEGYQARKNNKIQDQIALKPDVLQMFKEAAEYLPK